MRWLFALLFFFTSVTFAHLDYAEIPKITYQLSKEPIDVVIPCIAKDLLTLEQCIEGIRKNGKNIRRIIVVSKECLTSSAEWFDEANYPFSKQSIALQIFHNDQQAAQNFLAAPNTRIGWIYQQFLKLYAPFVIPNISSNVLILDSDVIFLQPTEFMNEKGNPYFIPGKEHHNPYFEHLGKLLSGLKRVHEKYSGIAHHMLFQKPILEDLFALTLKQHNLPLLEAICQCIDLKELYGSPFSEYEIYFNFVLLRTNQGTIREAKWREINHLKWVPFQKKEGCVFIACPEWQRNLSP